MNTNPADRQALIARLRSGYADCIGDAAALLAEDNLRIVELEASRDDLITLANKRLAACRAAEAEVARLQAALRDWKPGGFPI